MSGHSWTKEWAGYAYYWKCGKCGYGISSSPEPPPDHRILVEDDGDDLEEWTYMACEELVVLGVIKS